MTTYLPATLMGRGVHLYLILELFSRTVVGWEVHEGNRSDHAIHFVRRPTLAMLSWLGVKPSFTRAPA